MEHLIFDLRPGHIVTLNKHGETIPATFGFYRELTVKTVVPTFEIHTSRGMIWTGAMGEAVPYNDYSTSLDWSEPTYADYKSAKVGIQRIVAEWGAALDQYENDPISAYYGFYDYPALDSTPYKDRMDSILATAKISPVQFCDFLNAHSRNRGGLADWQRNDCDLLLELLIVEFGFTY